MSTYIVPIGWHHEVHTTIADRSTPWGVNASSIVFNGDADIAAGTATTTYYDYCAAEIVHLEIASLLEGTVDDDLIAHAVAMAGLECTCADADEDEDA